MIAYERWSFRDDREVPRLTHISYFDATFRLVDHFLKESKIGKARKCEFSQSRDHEA